jgi:hypothetical protein
MALPFTIMDVEAAAVLGAADLDLRPPDERRAITVAVKFVRQVNRALGSVAPLLMFASKTWRATEGSP